MGKVDERNRIILVMHILHERILHDESAILIRSDHIDKGGRYHALLLNSTRQTYVNIALSHHIVPKFANAPVKNS